jgi:choline dehydrogenase-like flavoprotein
MVVASRLTECSNIRVLVLEAGPQPGVVANNMYPGGNQYLSGDPRTGIQLRLADSPCRNGDRLEFLHRAAEEPE